MSVECCICNTLPCTLHCPVHPLYTGLRPDSAALHESPDRAVVQLVSSQTQHNNTYTSQHSRTSHHQLPRSDHSEEQSTTVSPARAWLLEQGRTFKPLIRQNWSVWQDWSSFSQNFPHHLLSSTQTEGSWMNVFEILFQCFIFTWPGEVIGDTCYLQTRRATKDINLTCDFFFLFFSGQFSLLRKLPQKLLSESCVNVNLRNKFWVLLSWVTRQQFYTVVIFTVWWPQIEPAWASDIPIYIWGFRSVMLHKRILSVSSVIFL